MTYHRTRHHRRSIRLPGYDYSHPGTYFVTICTRARECLLGDIVAGCMVPSSYGEIVKHEWRQSAVMRAELAPDVFVVMPNHLHGLVAILEDTQEGAHVGAHGRAPLHRPPQSLGSFVAGFKAAATKRINIARQTPGLPVWQRNYFERVIRSEEELNRVRQYIIDNPLRWEEDPENPALQGGVGETQAGALKASQMDELRTANESIRLTTSALILEGTRRIRQGPPRF